MYKWCVMGDVVSVWWLTARLSKRVYRPAVRPGILVSLEARLGEPGGEAGCTRDTLLGDWVHNPDVGYSDTNILKVVPTCNVICTRVASLLLPLAPCFLTNNAFACLNLMGCIVKIDCMVCLIITYHPILYWRQKYHWIFYSPVSTALTVPVFLLVSLFLHLEDYGLGVCALYDDDEDVFLCSSSSAFILGTYSLSPGSHYLSSWIPQTVQHIRLVVWGQEYTDIYIFFLIVLKDAKFNIKY